MKSLHFTPLKHKSPEWCWRHYRS